MILSDSRESLEAALSHLNKIEQIYKASMSEKNIPKGIRTAIKDFLGQTHSALNYPSVDIFEKYCRGNIPQSKLKNIERKVQFPVYQKKEVFDKQIENVFTGLGIARHDVLKVFEDCQPFGSSKWLLHLNFLSNENKHRIISRQKRQETTQIHFMKDVYGNTFTDCTFVNVGTPIVYNDTPVNFLNPQPNPYIKSLNASVEIDYIFADINQSVLPTLGDIYTGAVSVVNDLEEIL